MVTEIPWGDGSGDLIYLTYSASTGDQTVLVSSDPNAGAARTKDITFVSTVGNISRTLTVLQEAGMDYVSITWNDVCVTFNDTAIAYPDTTQTYIKDGLVMWLDGIDKGPDETAWVDKINGYIFTNNGAIFNTDHVYLDGSSSLVGSTTPTFPLTESGTIEVVYKKGGDYGVLVSPPSGSSQLGFGFISGYGLMWSTVSSRPKYSDGPNYGSVSISLARAFGNGVALTQNGSSYLSLNSNSPAYIGRRNYGAGNPFTGSIYCIRLYNRQLTQDEVLYNFGIDDSRFNLGSTDYIEFEDANVESICVSNWGDSVGLTRLKAGNVMSSQFGTTFRDNTYISSFDELQYFIGLTEIPGNAFYGCTALTSVVLPSGITGIGGSAFANCTNLTGSFVIPSSVTTLGSYVFYKTGITSLTIPASVTSYSGTLCYEMGALEELHLYARLNPATSNFFTCYSLVKLYVTDFEQSQTLLPNQTNFDNNTVYFGNNSNTHYVYFNDVEVRDLEIPSGVTRIKAGACYRWNRLTSVTIPSSVTEIGANAFDGVGTTTDKCTFVLLPTTPPSLSNANAFTANCINVIYVPNGTLSAYQSATNWSNFASYMAELNPDGTIPT